MTLVVPLLSPASSPRSPGSCSPGSYSWVSARSALFLSLFTSSFYSNKKTLPHADWPSEKHELANQQAAARLAASRSRFRPDLETNKTAGVAGGSCGPSLSPATLNWSLGQTGNPRGIALSPLQGPTPKPWPGLRLRKSVPPDFPSCTPVPLAYPARLPHSTFLRRAA